MTNALSHLIDFGDFVVTFLGLQKNAWRAFVRWMVKQLICVCLTLYPSQVWSHQFCVYFFLAREGQL